MATHRFALNVALLASCCPGLADAEYVPGVEKIRPERGYGRTPDISDSDYVSLVEIQSAFGLEVAVDPVTHLHQIRGKNIRAALCPGMARAFLNGSYPVLGRPVVYLHGQLLVPSDFTRLLRRASPLPNVEPVRTPLTPQVKAVERASRTILLDPGHGGNDPGASGRGGLREKEVVLDVALRLKRMLEMKGHKVLMSRSGDTYPTLSQRTRLCKQKQPDLFVSIHINSVDSRSVTGVETFLSVSPLKLGAGGKEPPKLGDLRPRIGPEELKLDGDTRAFVYDLYFQEFHAESRRLAQSIQSALVKGLPGEPDRKVKQRDLFVVRWSQAPAVLVELGFVSNAGTEKKMRTSAHRVKMAQALLNGIENYLY